MRRLLMVTVVALAGCTGEHPVQGPAAEGKPPGAQGTTLATFTATVDLVAGTIDIQTTPAGSAPGKGPSTAALNMTGLAMSNGTAPWIGSPAEHGCGLVPTWGTNVLLTSSYATSTATGVHAEITGFGGGTGNYPACNRILSVAPDLSNTYGLWYYPNTIVAGGTRGLDWTFPYVSASRFTFTGRLVGGLLDSFPVTPPHNKGPVAIVGSNVVYGTATGIAFVNSSGVNVGTARNLPLAPTALATTGSRIWYVTADSGVDHYPYAGYTSTDGTGGNSVKVTGLGIDPVLSSIVPDPTDPNVAWFVSSGPTYLVKMDTTSLDTASWLTAFVTPFTPSKMAVGSDGLLYVSSTWGDRIMRWNPANPEAGSVPTDTSAACSEPGDIVAATGGKIWFTASTGICRMDEGSTAAPVVITAVPWPQALCSGPGGDIWYLRFGGSNDGILIRSIEGASRIWMYVVSTNAYSLACTTGASGVAWVLGEDANALLRVTP